MSSCKLLKLLLLFPFFGTIKFFDDLSVRLSNTASTQTCNFLSIMQAISLRWSDFDANMHLRHSAYYDFGATARLDFFNAQGLTYELMKVQHIGPVLFREEALFKREVRLGDKLSINILVTRLRADYSRFSFRHEITRDDGILCAIINVDGAWLDTKLRKLTLPPEIIVKSMEGALRSEDFEWV